ncbi:MAG: hypothetical protein H0T62_06325 [Parachlamydiaceae bacterium]|nr:hypothetical protein [Parachlamydiaceae bacterium]
MQVVLGGIAVGNQVTTSYNNKKLGLVSEEQSLNWDTNPVRIRDVEWRTLNSKRVLDIMQGDNLTPSSLAGLKKNEIVCETIHLIDRLYSDALLRYKQQLALASGEDLKHITMLLEQHKWARAKTSSVGIVGGGATGALIGASLGPGGAAIGGIAGAIFGLLAGFFGGGELKKRYIQHEGSANRVKWIHMIDFSEDARFKTISHHILNASRPLLEDLLDLDKTNQSDRLKIIRLQQLCLVYKVIFNESSLQITLDPYQKTDKTEPMDVNHYVDELIQKYGLNWNASKISELKSPFSVKELSKNFNGSTSESESDISKKSKLQPTPKCNLKFSKHTIARDLWLDANVHISDQTEKKVNLISDYLKIRGFKLIGVEGKGDCFCYAFLESYKTLSRRIPILNRQKDKNAYLRGLIAAQYAGNFSDQNSTIRADQIKKAGEWLKADGEGDLLAKIFEIHIRVVTPQVDEHGSDVNDMLTWPLKDKDSEEWGKIDELERPRDYIFIVDLGGHFICARPSTV